MENEQQTSGPEDERPLGKDMLPDDPIEETQPATSVESGKDRDANRSSRRRATIPDRDSPALIRWQTRLLPLMSMLLVGLTIFFLGASVYQLYGLKTSIVSSPQSSLDKEMEALRPLPGDLPSNTFEKTKWATLVRLEANAVERRYHQANTLLLARVWTIYLGFLTGMILALVGAAFILGKLREAVSHLDLSGHEWKAAIQSSSPGLILAVFGTTLMIVTILARVDIKVDDRPLYVTDVGVVPATNNNGEEANREAPEGNENISPTAPSSEGSEEDNLKNANLKLGQTGQGVTPAKRDINLNRQK
jgi:hypothetical protein